VICNTPARNEKCIEGKRAFGSHRYRREDNVKMDRREMKCEIVD
jgi:hypothetical protein